MVQNIVEVIGDMDAYPELNHDIASPPQELANFVNNMIDIGEPRIDNNIRKEGVQPLVLQEALLQEQARQVQIEEDAALADLLQDASDDDDDVEEVDSGFETDSVQEEDQQMDGAEAEVDSDAETVENNNPNQDMLQDSDSDSTDNDSDQDIDEVTLRRTMYLRQKFFRGVQQLLRLQRDEEMRRMRRRLRAIQRRIKHQRKDIAYDKPRRYRDMCYGCAKRFWCQRDRRWIRCTFCELWLCPDCNVDPVHCQNEQPFLP